MSRTRGVYFLANDRILDMTVAFLNSFRENNPTIPLCLVPYASDIEELVKLQDRYDFTVWADLDLLRRCDRVGWFFHGQIYGHYRKLALWEGMFDEFLYIDSDTVVLRDVDFVFDHLDDFDFVTAKSNIRADRQWVWHDSIQDVGKLTEEQVDFAANTGFIASRRGLLPFAKIRERLTAAVELGPHMQLWCIEQPLLNYLIVTSGRRYSSLYAIAAHTGATDIPQEEWAGGFDAVVRDGVIVSPQSPPTLLVHWAGEWARARLEGTQIPHYDLWSHYRELHTRSAPSR